MKITFNFKCQGLDLGLHLAYESQSGSGMTTIDESYVEGLSITYDSNPRKHVRLNLEVILHHMLVTITTVSFFGCCQFFDVLL